MNTNAIYYGKKETVRDRQRERYIKRQKERERQIEREGDYKFRNTAEA